MQRLKQRVLGEVDHTQLSPDGLVHLQHSYTLQEGNTDGAGRPIVVLLEEDVLPDTSILENLLKSAEARLKKFIEDPQEREVFIVRSLPPGEEGGVASSAFSPTYEVRLGLNGHNTEEIGPQLLNFVRRPHGHASAFVGPRGNGCLTLGNHQLPRTSQAKQAYRPWACSEQGDVG